MRTIDELGISPTPWKRMDNHPLIVLNGINLPLVSGIKPEDARLFAAAPELYECLREAICQTCLYCKYKKCNECNIVNKWKDAIAKANGEEVK